ncbi:MAG TPA: glycerophosphodiester phosphodiesterase [Solirubrobacteraceae bacterium]|nr:glycerophosphodiester phosphodiesterase [Solirubrobacteraceae bacterium]
MTLVIAHRGASAGAPANSLEAFELAIALGADMIECDVRRTRDGELVTFHDEDVTGTPLRLLTRDGVAERLGHRPPLFEEVLELCAGRIGVDIELKEDGYVERVLALARARLEPEGTIVTSFRDGVLAQVRRHAAELRTGLLLGREDPDRLIRTRISELFPVARARRCGATLIAPHQTLGRFGALRRAAAAGLGALVWTVNRDDELIRHLRDPRVDGVITDVPARAVALRAQLRR